MTNWKIFQGNQTPHDGVSRLPPPPVWRPFSPKAADRPRGARFQARPEAVELVNAALYLRRPLLITGKPGTGKTSLAYAVAYELQLGEVLYWPVTTRTTLKDGLYRYDAIGRLQEAKDNIREIGKYIQLGPLGTAFLPSDKPRVLLIDEIDKSDIDLPNDLLHILEEGKFDIPELFRIAKELETVEVQTAYTDDKEPTYAEVTVSITRGRVRCREFPLTILTSNGERDFPPAFLRRCLRLNLEEPSPAELESIVAEHLGKTTAEDSKGLIEEFFQKRQTGQLATDQLLNAIYLLTREQAPVGKDKEALVEHLLKYLDSSDGL